MGCPVVAAPSCAWSAGGGGACDHACQQRRTVRQGSSQLCTYRSARGQDGGREELAGTLSEVAGGGRGGGGGGGGGAPPGAPLFPPPPGLGGREGRGGGGGSGPGPGAGGGRPRCAPPPAGH